MTPAEADQTIGDVMALIENLSKLMQQETALIHAGQVKRASELGTAKTDLASRLYVISERLKVNARFIMQCAPGRCAALAQMQDAFRLVLQKNMIVLATAHAVSEGIVRRLSKDLARKSSPQLYGATGRATAPSPKYGQPLAFSKKL